MIDVRIHGSGTTRLNYETGVNLQKHVFRKGAGSSSTRFFDFFNHSLSIIGPILSNIKNRTAHTGVARSDRIKECAHLMCAPAAGSFAHTRGAWFQLATAPGWLGILPAGLMPMIQGTAFDDSGLKKGFYRPLRSSARRARRKIFSHGWKSDGHRWDSCIGIFPSAFIRAIRG